jgi:hypothetical protein
VTATDLLKEVANGALVIVGEYRGCRVSTNRFVDRNSGNVIGRPTILHLVECGHGASIVRVILTEAAPEGIGGVDVNARYVRGHHYVFFLQSIKKERGQITGSLDSREPEPWECS